jgi:hypothetical protein
MPSRTVAAFDVASRSYGKVHSAVLMMIPTKTRVTLNIFLFGAGGGHFIPPFQMKKPGV